MLNHNVIISGNITVDNVIRVNKSEDIVNKHLDEKILTTFARLIGLQVGRDELVFFQAKLGFPLIFRCILN